MKRLLLLAGVFCLTLVATPKAIASDEDRANAALAASMTWVTLIDVGSYDDSYAFGCDTLQEEIPADHWTKVLRALRAPWGPVTSRKQISHIYKPDGFAGNSGEFMVITYDTSFKKMPDAMEVIVLKRDGGKWRGAGYNAGAKPSADGVANIQQQNSSTEVNTQMHVKP